jgi:hypothetical protein
MTPETNDTAGPQGASGAVVETTTATFRQDVMTASMSQLVLAPSAPRRTSCTGNKCNCRRKPLRHDLCVLMQKGGKRPAEYP